VCAAMADPAASGLVASLSRPGANITGLAIFSQELYGKRLGLLMEAVPRIRRVAFLLNPDNPVYVPIFQSLQPLAKSLRVELRRFDVRGARELNGVFSAMAKERIDAVEFVEDGTVDTFAHSIVDLAIKQRLPSVTGSEFSGFGALIGYGVSREDLFRRAAYYVDKILRGAKPGDLPVEQPTQFDFIVNMKTARALGIAIPQSFLQRADRLID
jgi:putative ABC transport system substrate-binding protein